MDARARGPMRSYASQPSVTSLTVTLPAATATTTAAAAAAAAAAATAVPLLASLPARRTLVRGGKNPDRPTEEARQARTKFATNPASLATGAPAQ